MASLRFTDKRHRSEMTLEKTGQFAKQSTSTPSSTQASVVMNLLKIMDDEHDEHTTLQGTQSYNGNQSFTLLQMDNMTDDEPNDLIVKVGQLTKNCEMKSKLQERENYLADLEIAKTFSDAMNINTLDKNVKKLNDFATVLDTVGKNVGLIMNKLRQASRFDGEVINKAHHKFITDSLALLKLLPAKIDSSLEDFEFTTENLTVEILRGLCESRFSSAELVKIAHLMCAHRQLVITLQKLKDDKRA